MECLQRIDIVVERAASVQRDDVVNFKVFLQKLATHGTAPLLACSHTLGLEWCDTFSPRGNAALPRTRKLSTGLASDAPSAWGMRHNTPGALGWTTIVIVIAPGALAQHCHGAVESLPRRVVEAGSRRAQPGADGDSGHQQEEKTEHALFTPCIVMSHNNRVLYICSLCTRGKGVDLDVGCGRATTCCKWGGCGKLVHGT